ncbi:hypothetical protein HPP92_006741 [Vanilla planifolia]|uniref:Uncharacterized protein n=1 Tax=Vanilla planifolia TaxID=51239 RepID=A0A835V9Y9_VANPL|nr:hypothetical protein HPP92_006741 [Vanilla planifolia]
MGVDGLGNVGLSIEGSPTRPSAGCFEEGTWAKPLRRRDRKEGHGLGRTRTGFSHRHGIGHQRRNHRRQGMKVIQLVLVRLASSP